MIGKYKNNKIIKCDKCKSENLDELDHSFEYDGGKVLITYDVQCIGCDNKFEIIDIFEYKYSEKN